MWLRERHDRALQLRREVRVQGHLPVRWRLRLQDCALELTTRAAGREAHPPLSRAGFARHDSDVRL